MTQHKSKRMLVLCPFPENEAAGQRLKYEQYFDDWRAEGWHIDVSCYMDPKMWKVVYQSGHLPQKIAGVIRGHLRRVRDIFRIRNYDMVYVFMWVTPVGTSIMERCVRGLAHKLVYDVEDNILIEQNLPKGENPNPLARLLKGPSKAKFLIRSANHVITSSPFLNDYCLTKNSAKQCTYISSSINTDIFLPVNKYTNEKIVTIGWTGTYSSKIFLDLLSDMFQKLAEKLDYKLRVIGNFEYELAGVNLEVIQWSKEREVEDLQGIDIGVYPLPQDDWVLGKSGLKAIQYMAFGIPPVASDVGMTSRILAHGENGLLVKTENDWLTALEHLIQNPDERKKIGKAARRDAVNKYSTHAVKKDYQRVLESVMEKEHD